MQTDDCAAETHGCWTHSEGLQQFSACRDTFRGYVCKCPEGGAGLPAPLPSLLPTTTRDRSPLVMSYHTRQIE